MFNSTTPEMMRRGYSIDVHLLKASDVSLEPPAANFGSGVTGISRRLGSQVAQISNKGDSGELFVPGTKRNSNGEIVQDRRHSMGG